MVMEWEDGSSAGSKKVLRVREESANLGGCPNPKKAATQPSFKSQTPQHKRIGLAGYMNTLRRRTFFFGKIPEESLECFSRRWLLENYTLEPIVLHQPLLLISGDNSTAIHRPHYCSLLNLRGKYIVL
jgi:hypothetical protein